MRGEGEGGAPVGAIPRLSLAGSVHPDIGHVAAHNNPRGPILALNARQELKERAIN